MRGVRQIVVATAFAVGCASAPRPVQLGPLDREGEVHVVALPLPDDAARLAFRVASVAAVRSDGAEVPLQVVNATLSRAELPHPRLLARGRLEPGAYTGFSIGVARATLSRDGAAADLLVGKEPLRVEWPFEVERRRAVVVTLSVKPSPANDRAVLFAPELAAGAARAPLVQQSVFCTSGGLHELAVFDRRSGAMSAVIPTGREPWGIAVDPVQGRIFVALSGEDAVIVLDGVTREEVGRVQLRPGDAPRELALTPDGRLLLSANAGSNTVSFIDPGSMLEDARVDAGQAPTALLLDRTGARVYVSNARSTFLTVVDVPHRGVIGTIASEFSPLRPALSRDGTRLYVASPQSSHLAVVSTATLATTSRVYVGIGTTALEVDPATDLVYVGQGGLRRLAVLEPRALVTVDHVRLAGDAAYLAVAAAENTLLAILPERGTVAAIELGSKRTVGEIDVGPSPRVLALGGGRN